jgi:hypothetical protein
MPVNNAMPTKGNIQTACIVFSLRDHMSNDEVSGTADSTNIYVYDSEWFLKMGNLTRNMQRKHDFNT